MYDLDGTVLSDIFLPYFTSLRPFRRLDGERRDGGWYDPNFLSPKILQLNTAYRSTELKIEYKSLPR